MVITEKVEVQARSMTMTVRIKGDKVRMDASPQMSTIVDTSTGDTTTILHASKSYMTLSKAQTDQLRKLKDQTTAANTPAGKPKLVDTGKAEKVGDYNSEIYTLDTPAAHFTFWATKDIPNYAAVKEQLRKFRAVSHSGGASAPDTSGMDGIAAKTQIVTKGQTMAITILSAEEKPIEDSEMAPPSGYTKVSMP